MDKVETGSSHSTDLLFLCRPGLTDGRNYTYFAKKVKNLEKRPFSKEIPICDFAESIFSLAFTISATEYKAKAPALRVKAPA